MTHSVMDYRKGLRKECPRKGTRLAGFGVLDRLCQGIKTPKAPDID